MDLDIADLIEVGLLREGASDEPIDLLIAAALPGAVGVAEEVAALQPAGDLQMQCELLAVVAGDRVDSATAQCLDDRVGDDGRSPRS